MKVRFEIKEKMSEIIKEILHSDKWVLIVESDSNELKRVKIKDPAFDSEASIEIWKEEIHIKTAWSNYTYRIFQQGNKVICEYVGAYRGLLEQLLLPELTPLNNILDSEVLDTSIEGEVKETLRNYAEANLELKKQRREASKEEYTTNSVKDHPSVVYDEYVKEGTLIPTHKHEKDKNKPNTPFHPF